MQDKRYAVSGWKIMDSESDPVPEIYIRELLDMPSAEFQKSRLSAREKMNVIEALGLEVLTRLLDDSFRQNGKPHDAAQEAEFTVAMLNRILERQSSPAPLAEASAEEKPVVTFMHQYFEERDALFLAAEESSAPYRQAFYTKALNDKFDTDEEAARSYARQHPAAVVEVELSGDEATVITSEPVGGMTDTHIYHLVKAQGHWKISKRGRECQICGGTGRAYGTPCSLCDDGWQYSGIYD